MAKRFMFVCIGILALVLAYELGATRASAQLSGTIAAAGLAANGSLGGQAFAVVGRKIFGTMNPITTDPVPGTDAIIAVGTGGEGGAQVMLANGDVYATEPGFHVWTFEENVLGSPTSATRSTWGTVKAKYHN
jgi:hypothetical protein